MNEKHACDVLRGNSFICNSATRSQKVERFVNIVRKKISGCYRSHKEIKSGDSISRRPEYN